MSCDSVQERLTALADDELDVAEAAEVQAHLADCADCSRVFAETRAVERLAAAWETDAADVWPAIRQAIGAPEGLSDVALIEEMRALRAELGQVRAELADLRRQLAARASQPAPRSSYALLPYAPPDEPALRIM